MIINPAIYAKSCLNAISVWGMKVLPLMFPFFVLTRLISTLHTPKDNFMDKFFNKFYNSPCGSFATFFLSSLCGYPMGAKLISQKVENNQITSSQAKGMLAFCSVSGPMFIIGTVGVSMFYSFKAGVIILISNIIASLINGLFYKDKTLNNNKQIFINVKTQTLSDCVYDSLVSILMIGAYIVLSFILIDMLDNLKIISTLSKAICCVFNANQYHNVVSSSIKGFLEITRGAYDLSLCVASLKIKTIIASGLIGFGGISILLQSLNFLKNINISVKTILKQKTTQGILCVLITTLLLMFIKI